MEIALSIDNMHYMTHTRCSNRIMLEPFGWSMHSKPLARIVCNEFFSSVLFHFGSHLHIILHLFIIVVIVCSDCINSGHEDGIL